jgi:hypothetical protein
MPPTDQFSSHAPGMTSPASAHFGITPNDSADLAILPRGIFVGGAGDITIVDKNGDSATYTVAAVPFILPFRGVRVMATGTTATALVGMTD